MKMNIQYDLFDRTEEEKKITEAKQKIEYLAKGKYLRGLRGVELMEAHEKKWDELFGD
jgi:hypothetical protein